MIADDSNLAISSTIFILRLIDTDTYLKVNKMKLNRIYYHFVKKNNLISSIVYEILMYTFHTEFWNVL